MSENIRKFKTSWSLRLLGISEYLVVGMYQAMTLCDLPWPIIKNLKCTLRNFHISDALLYHTPPSPIGKFSAVITGIKLLVLNGKISNIANCKTKSCPKN